LPVVKRCDVLFDVSSPYASQPGLRNPHGDRSCQARREGQGKQCTDKKNIKSEKIGIVTKEGEDTQKKRLTSEGVSKKIIVSEKRI
jgi:hypothetical protein